MGYFFILPLILGIAFIFLPNLIMLVQFSVSDVIINGSKGYDTHFIGFVSYYQALFVDPNFIPYNLPNAYKQTFINVPVILIFSLFISVLLNQKFHGRAAARAIFFLPVILATGLLDDFEKTLTGGATATMQAVSGDYLTTFKLGQMLSDLNFSQALIDIIESAVTGIYSVLKNSGMQIYIFLAGLQEIPLYLYEAAEVEGCSKWESFWKITFPMLTPQILVNLVYTMVAIGQGGPVLGYANHLASREGRYSLGMAMIVLYLISLAIVLLLIFGILARIMRKQTE